MKDVTEKYVNMISAFECDFAVTNIDENGNYHFIFKHNDRLLQDIHLLQELSFNLRHNLAKIEEVV